MNKGGRGGYLRLMGKLWRTCRFSARIHAAGGDYRRIELDAILTADPRGRGQLSG